VAEICVIGFTGAFGSGCTRAAKTARDQRGFTYISLSEEVRGKWADDHPDGQQATRTELQALGDQLRETQGRDVLARLAFERLGVLPERIVIDGIRNTAEIGYLRARFGYSFSLVAVLASIDMRWARVTTHYTDRGLDRLAFQQDDKRDQNEDLLYGQQVGHCVAAADVFLDNSGDIASFDEKVVGTVDLITGEARRPARTSEVLMHMAFSASHTSQCLKRHVGAVVADARGQLVSVGYNENPLGTNPCVLESEYKNQCFRDIVRDEHFRGLAARAARCPVCSEPIPEIAGPPWNCPTCAARETKTNLEEYFFPDRAMNWCTAVHAEVWAIMAAADRARGATLYTTTFPCLQCVEKIAQAGVVRVVYTEAYTDKFSELRLQLSGITSERFEGVRSSSFERLFPRPS
jgi:deoxycytidylate deaminase/dephospho-CoA kinase